MGAQGFTRKRQGDLRFASYEELGAHRFLQRLYPSAYGRLTEPRARAARWKPPQLATAVCFDLIDFHKSPLHRFIAC
jgi:hypothetical protein